MSKLINHLGSDVEQMARKGHGVPDSLAQRLDEMRKYTSVVRAVFATKLPLLPLANWERCFVINVAGGCVTISVDSYTLANQLRYLAADYLQAFRHESVLFAEMKQMRVVTTHYAV